MFAEWLPVAKSAKCCASSWARNYTIYTVCGFCCPLENNELMREFSQDTGAQFCAGQKVAENSGLKEGWELTVSGSPRYYLARIWSPEKCRDNYTKMPVLISSSHDLYETRARVTGDHTWRQYLWWPPWVREARRKLSNHFYPHCKCIEGTEVLL